MNNNNINVVVYTHHKLLPRLIDAFENLCDLLLILLMNCNTPDKRLLLELS